MLYFAGNMVMNGENEGVALIGINESYVQKMLKSAKLTDNSRIFLADKNLEYLIGSDKEPVDSFLFAQPSGSTIGSGREEYLIMSSSIEPYGISEKWMIYMLVPVSDMYREVSLLRNLIIGLILFSCVLIIIMIRCMNRWLVDPVMKLSSAMNRVQEGHMDVRVDSGYQDEMGDLCRGFNSMVQTLDISMKQIRTDEEAKRKLEIRMLQEQINPHFIRNTLNTFRWMAELKGALGISKAISAFTGIIDYSLGGNENMVCLKDELFYLEKYIYIQKIRYQNLFIYEVHVPEGLMDALIPKLILQPIVENSVHHGITEKMGVISVSAEEKDKDLLLHVMDDGSGMDKERIAEILSGAYQAAKRHSHHIGLYNVCERLRLIYGEPYGVTIESEVEQYTRITLRIPLKLRGEEERSEQNKDSAD